MTPPQSSAAASDGHRAPATGSGSPLGQTALLAYVVLLIYGSLTPWQGWRSLGVNPFAFLAAPLPTHVTAFDLTLNVLAYMPLGLLAALAIHPRLRGLSALVAATIFGVLLSVLVETLQNYLPMRIASNLDVLTNAAGTTVGAAAGTLLSPALIDRGRLQQTRQRWLRPDAGPLLLIVLLWPLAQIHPGPMLFGNGELDREWVAWVLQWFGGRIAAFDAGQFAAAEALVTATSMLAAGAALTAGMKRGAPRTRLLALLFAVALLTKAITYGHEFGPARTMAWLTPGAVSGLLVGALAAIAAASAATPRAPALLAVTALLALIASVNVVPPNPYHAHWISAWQPGRMRDVAAASDWLAQAWPYVMLATVLWWLRRARQQEAAMSR